jgi:hypothetical protein
MPLALSPRSEGTLADSPTLALPFFEHRLFFLQLLVAVIKSMV